MSDDGIERALFALPLKELPAGLHAQILAAAANSPWLAFRGWEIWFVGTALAFMVRLAFLVATSVHDPGSSIAGEICRAVDRFAAMFSLNALVWTVLAISFVVCVAQRSLPSPRRRSAGR